MFRISEIFVIVVRLKLQWKLEKFIDNTVDSQDKLSYIEQISQLVHFDLYFLVLQGFGEVRHL